MREQVNNYGELEAGTRTMTLFFQKNLLLVLICGSRKYFITMKFL